VVEPMQSAAGFDWPKWWRKGKLGRASQLRELVDRLGTARFRAETRARRAEAELERLREAVENYILWQPGRRGHAAAHRKLVEALEQPRA
jgi:hypothetical protein